MRAAEGGEVMMALSVGMQGGGEGDWAMEGQMWAASKPGPRSIRSGPGARRAMQREVSSLWAEEAEGTS